MALKHRMGCSSLEAPEMLLVVITYLPRKALGSLAENCRIIKVGKDL